MNWSGIKGKYIFCKMDDYTVIDTETTGLDPEFDSVIELAAVKVRKGEIVDTFEQLVNPGCEISDFTAELTGITNEMLSKQPNIADVLQTYFDSIGEDVVLGHNVIFDIRFLTVSSINCYGKPFLNNYMCSYCCAMRFFKGLKCYKLQYLCEKYHVGAEPCHRALADVYSANALYRYMVTLDENVWIQNSFRYHHERARDFVRDAEAEVNENGKLFGRVIVITGTLTHFTRASAMQAVVNAGGINGDGITKKTNYLVLGNNDYCKNIKGGKSTKQKMAEKAMLAGQDIQIISENVFIDMLSEKEE